MLCIADIYRRPQESWGSKVYLLDHFLSIPSAVFRFCASQNVVGLIEANIARRIIYAGQVPPLAHAAHACGRRWSQQKDNVGSEFSDVQIVHKFTRWVASNPDLKGTPLFDVDVSAEERHKIDTHAVTIQTTNRKWYVTYWIVPSPMTFSDLIFEGQIL